jgi:hypothetical protein
MAFEFRRSVQYRYQRSALTPTLNGNTIQQTMGDREVIQVTIEWVVADRIFEVLEEEVAQIEASGFVLSGEPNVSRTIGEGHNLFDVSFTASRFLPSELVVTQAGILRTGA